MEISANVRVKPSKAGDCVPPRTFRFFDAKVPENKLSKKTKYLPVTWFHFIH